MAAQQEGECPNCHNWHNLQGHPATLVEHRNRFGVCSGSGCSPVQARVHLHTMDAYWRDLSKTALIHNRKPGR